MHPCQASYSPDCPARAPDRLLDYPRIGEKLEAYAPREVRRIIVGNYELR
ncbi:hypothetical protein [Sphingomonas sp. YL-JM2C]